MRRTVRTTFILTLSLGAAACQELPTEPSPQPTPAAMRAGAGSLDIGAGGFDPSDFGLPAAARISDARSAEVVSRAINPDDYVCSPSALSAYAQDLVLELLAEEPDILFELFLPLGQGGLSVELVMLADALLFLSDDTPQSFGFEGQYTNVLERTHKDLTRFWDIRSDDIQLLALKGTLLLDVERVTMVYVALGIPPALALQLAERVRELVLASNLLNGGNHPLFSLNAFAFTDFGGALPDKLIMGDGILAFYETLGLEDVAAQAIQAHEFAHHIQFEKGYADDAIVADGDAAEQTRYAELMADAYAAYYMAHKRGAALNPRRVEQFLRVFFQVGDCSFAASTHHGTPNQRLAASQFGFQLAAGAKKKGQILSAEEFHDLFVASYPELIAPDA